jgi:hypothetical protein
MESTIEIFSEAYAPSPLSNPYAIGVNDSFWREIMNETQEGRCFLRIQVGEKEWIAPVGEPVMTHSSENCVYMPNWMLRSAGLEGIGETGHCSILDTEAFPEATKLVLKVVDSAFYDSEIKEELEIALSSLGVVKSQTLLQIPIASLGGFTVDVFLVKTEPADIVLCQGEEVAVEFEEPVDHVEPVVSPPRPPTPIPMNEPMLLPQTEVTGFVPFQGEGHRLVGANPDLPEWRKNLPFRKKERI